MNEGKATQSLKVTSVHLENDFNSQDQGSVRWDKAWEATVVKADARQLDASACGNSWYIMENYGIRRAL